jgi:hypothetical protein
MWDKRDPNWKQDYYGASLPFILRLEEFQKQMEEPDDDNIDG